MLGHYIYSKNLFTTNVFNVSSNVRSNVRSNAIPNVIFNVRFNVRFNALVQDFFRDTWDYITGHFFAPLCSLLIVWQCRQPFLEGRRDLIAEHFYVSR